jgi:hypothetical protein
VRLPKAVHVTDAVRRSVACEIARVLASDESQDGKGSTGTKQLAHPLKSRALIHVVKGSNRDDEIECLALEREDEKVAEDVVDFALGVLLTRKLDAVRVDVDRRDVDHALTQLAGDDPFSAADV